MITLISTNKHMCLQKYLSSIHRKEHQDMYLVTMKPYDELKTILGGQLRTTWGTTSDMRRIMQEGVRCSILVSNKGIDVEKTYRIGYNYNSWPAECFYIKSKSNDLHELKDFL